MPMHVAKSGSCPASKPWACIKDSDGTVEGCHVTKEDAEAQMAALYANEPGANMSVMVDERAVAAALRGTALGAGTSREIPRGVGVARAPHFKAIELRANRETYNGIQLVHMRGHASVTDTPYDMWDMFGPYQELIERIAFEENLKTGPDVAFLVNHTGRTMARTVPLPGKEPTLRLAMDDVGLLVDAWVNPERQDVKDFVIAVDDGDMREMSFAFMLDEDGGTWNDAFDAFTISKLDLDRGDVSGVNYGANPYTDIASRASDVLAYLDRLPTGAARAALARLQHRQDLAAVRSLEPATPLMKEANLIALEAWLAVHGD